MKIRSFYLIVPPTEVIVLYWTSIVLWYFFLYTRFFESKSTKLPNLIIFKSQKILAATASRHFVLMMACEKCLGSSLEVIAAKSVQYVGESRS